MKCVDGTFFYFCFRMQRCAGKRMSGVTVRAFTCTSTALTDQGVGAGGTREIDDARGRDSQ